MPDDPLVRLTKRLERPDQQPDDLTEVTAPIQLEYYLATDFESSRDGYGMDFLEYITLRDKLLMMAIKGDRADQYVEIMRGMQAPLGIDAGRQPVDEYPRERRRFSRER